MSSTLTHSHSCREKPKKHHPCTTPHSTLLTYSRFRLVPHQSDSIDQAFAEIPIISSLPQYEQFGMVYYPLHSNSIGTAITQSTDNRSKYEDPMEDYEYSRQIYFNTVVSANGRSNSSKVEKPHQLKLNTTSMYPPHDKPSKSSKNNFNDIKKEFSNLWKTQSGCRQVQRAIEEHGYDCICAIMEKFINDVNEITIHSYGNYVFQRLMSAMNEQDLLSTFYNLKKKMMDIAKKPYGMRSLQAFVAAIKIYPNIIKEFISELIPNLEELIMDQNASHVVQKSLILFDDVYLMPILESIYKNCLLFSKDMHGCCVVQKSLDNKEIFEGSLKHKIAIIITEHTDSLIIHPYGNYVIQMLICSRQKFISESIISKIKDSIAEFSCDKFASHPVEMAYEHASDELKLKIIDAMCQHCNVKRILFDQFGNYVIQKILKSCAKDQKKHILMVLKPLLGELSKTLHGSKIYMKLMKNYKEFL